MDMEEESAWKMAAGRKGPKNTRERAKVLAKFRAKRLRRVYGRKLYGSMARCQKDKCKICWKLKCNHVAGGRFGLEMPTCFSPQSVCSTSTAISEEVGESDLDMVEVLPANHVATSNKDLVRFTTLIQQSILQAFERDFQGRELMVKELEFEPKPLITKDDWEDLVELLV